MIFIQRIIIILVINKLLDFIETEFPESKNIIDIIKKIQVVWNLSSIINYYLFDITKYEKIGNIHVTNTATLIPIQKHEIEFRDNPILITKNIDLDFTREIKYDSYHVSIDISFIYNNRRYTKKNLMFDFNNDSSSYNLQQAQEKINEIRNNNGNIDIWINKYDINDIYITEPSSQFFIIFIILGLIYLSIDYCQKNRDKDECQFHPKFVLDIPLGIEKR